MWDKCNSDVSSEYKIMHFISAFKCKISLVFTFAHAGLLSSRISLNGLFFTFVDVSFFRLVGLSSWTCLFMSFFLSFYRFFLPSSLVEGKPCLSRPLFVQRHVWRLCVLSALLCSCVLLGSEVAMVWGRNKKCAIFVLLYFTCGCWFVEVLTNMKGCILSSFAA